VSQKKTRPSGIVFFFAFFAFFAVKQSFGHCLATKTVIARLLGLEAFGGILLLIAAIATIDSPWSDL
jgi:hypothetical protein